MLNQKSLQSVPLPKQPTHGLKKGKGKQKRRRAPTAAQAEAWGARLLGEAESPVRGPKGNVEFLLHLAQAS